MDYLFVEATETTPLVEFNKEKGIFRIEGRSLPEDVRNFYSPIVQWLENYTNEPNKETQLFLHFEYFNTASSKMILLLLNKIRDIQKKGNSVLVTWSYPQHDAELEDAGEEFAELLNIPFQFVAKY